MNFSCVALALLVFIEMCLARNALPTRLFVLTLISFIYLDPLLINLTQKAGSKSEAFDFASSSTDSNHTKRYKTLHGATRQREQPDLQPKSREIFVLFSDDWENEYTIEVPAGEQEFYYRFVITADENEEVAWQEMDEGKLKRSLCGKLTVHSHLFIVLKHAPESLFKKHTEEWHKFWQDFNIEIEGNLEMVTI